MKLEGDPIPNWYAFLGGVVCGMGTAMAIIIVIRLT